MGRRRKTLTEEQMIQLEALAAYLTQDQIADYFGISDSTLRTRMREDPKISIAYNRGKQRAVSSVADTLIRQARGGNTTAMIFFLKTQGRWRETSVQEHEVGDGLKAFVDALREE